MLSFQLTSDTVKMRKGRGECRTFVEDVTDICAYTVEGDDFKLTDQEKDWAEELLGEKF